MPPQLEAAAAPVIQSPVASIPCDPAPAQAGIGVLADVPMPVSAVLGKVIMSLGQISELRPGHLLRLDRTAGDDLDLYVNGLALAMVEVVAAEDHLAFRITRMRVGD